MVRVYSVSPEEMEEFIGQNGRLGRPDKQKEPWAIVAEAEEAEIRNRDKPPTGRRETNKHLWEIVTEINERAVHARGGGGPKEGPPSPRFTIGAGMIWDKKITRYRPEEGECGCCHDNPLPPNTTCLVCSATDIDPTQWPMALTEEQEAKRQKRADARAARARKKARKQKVQRDQHYIQATLAEIAPEAGNQISEIFNDGDIRNDENGGLNVTPENF